MCAAERPASDCSITSDCDWMTCTPTTASPWGGRPCCWGWQPDSQPALASAMETTDRRHQDRWGEKVDADKAMGDKTSMQMPHARPQMQEIWKTRRPCLHRSSG
jgi:hypothetical protein